MAKFVIESVPNSGGRFTIESLPEPEPVDYLDETIGQFGAGVNRGIDSLINLPYNAVRGVAGLVGADLPEAQPIVSSLNVTGEPKTAVGEVFGATGEVAGSSALPAAGILSAGARAAPLVARGGNALTQGARNFAQKAAANPGTFAANEAAATVGAGTGIGTAREAELGPAGELAAGLAGGLVAPLGYAAGARAAGGVKSGIEYGNNMVRRARDPQLAADQDVADVVVKSGASFDDIRAEVSPQPSAPLKARGFTDENMADIIARKAGGESSASIAKDYGIAEGTVNSYVAKHADANPTPRNIADVVTDLQGAGAARPVTRLGRAAVGIADDADTTQALMSRQETQGGRAGAIINRAAGGKDFDTEVALIDDVLENQKNAAYALATRNAQPFNLRPAIRGARDAAFKSAGDIKQGLEKAIDLFFEPIMSPSGKVRRLGQPIADLKRYQAAREALDQMIQTSYKDGKPTRLTAKLTQFRKSVNNVVRNANKDMAAADDLFSGAKSTERLLQRGEEMTTRLGSKSSRELKEFSKLTPEQKEIYRLGFLRKLSNQADNTRDGGAVANQFQSEAVRKVVRKLFAPEPVRKSMSRAQKSALNKRNRAVVDRGERLIKDLRQEATTTRTKNEFLSGSRTAEYGADMGKMMQGAQTAANVATGRIGKFLGDLAQKLEHQIGERQAKAILQTLTETDPAQLLPMLNRLARQARTTQQRQAYVHAIRELRGERALSLTGVPITASQDRRQELQGLE